MNRCHTPRSLHLDLQQIEECFRLRNTSFIGASGPMRASCINLAVVIGTELHVQGDFKNVMGKQN